MLRIEADFPPGVEATDLTFGDLRFIGDLGTAGTGPKNRVQLVLTLITIADQLLTWCHGRSARTDLTSVEVKRLLTLRRARGGRVEVFGTQGPVTVAANVQEVCLALHTGVMEFLERYPDLNWTIAREDFWTVMADFRVQCLPDLIVDD